MGLFKKILLALGVLGGFYVGYAAPANAWPGVPDRNTWYGYFKNVRETTGTDVMPGGMPASVNNAETFITFMKGKLAEGPGSRNGVGAAFVIQTMIGLSRNLPPTAAEIADWEARVRYADANLMINWNLLTNYAVNSYYQPTPVDNAFYYENDTAYSIVFRNASGGIVYAIRRECVNPVGNLTALDPAPSYTISGRSTVSDTTVVPGQAITFSHYVSNSGPTALNVNWTARDGFVHNILQSGTSFFGSGVEINTSNQPFTVPANAALGTRYCQYSGFSPVTPTNAGPGRGTSACTQVVNDYELTPIVDSGGASSAQQGDTLTFTYKIRNTGPTTSVPIACRPVGGTKPPGYVPQPQQDIDKHGDPGFVAPPTTCPVAIPVGESVVATETVAVGSESPGSRICRALVINPRNEDGGFRLSAEACVVIAKTPYVHFMGNDIWAGGGFAAVNPACNGGAQIKTTGKTLSDGSVAGSAVEYAAFALGKITTFGSGNKALVNPAGPAGKVLSFSNFDSNNLGFYGATQHCINDYISKYAATPITSPGPVIDVAAAGDEVVHLSGNYTFSGTMPTARQKVYLVEGNVTVGGNLQYPAGYPSVSQIPSLVIIATGNISVPNSVDRMDGLFVTRGTLNTCSDPGDPSVLVCNNQLTINGAVIANKVELRRTYGADGATPAARKVPAEVFNFSPEMYLRSALNTTTSTILRTSDQKDLPPRF